MAKNESQKRESKAVEEIAPEAEQEVLKPVFAPLEDDEVEEDAKASQLHENAGQSEEESSSDSDNGVAAEESGDEEAEGAYLRAKGRIKKIEQGGTETTADSRFVLADEESGDTEEDGDGASEQSESEDDVANDQDITDPNALALPPLATAKPLTAKSLAKFQEKLEKTGVVYLSRVPPFMRPIKLRQLLSRFGEIGRIYLAPEDPRITARRKKYRHNKRQNYTEGWVEFTDKKVARQVAEHLSGKQVGGKKQSFYYDDLWNMKYLPRFKWNHLTEQIAYELKVREQRLKTEMAQAKRENKAYLKNVGKAKMVEAIEERKREKKRKAQAETEDNGQSGVAAGEGNDSLAIRRRFKQRKVVDSDAKKSNATPSRKKAAVLSKLFG